MTCQHESFVAMMLNGRAYIVCVDCAARFLFVHRSHEEPKK